MITTTRQTCATTALMQLLPRLTYLLFCSLPHSQRLVSAILLHLLLQQQQQQQQLFPHPRQLAVLPRWLPRCLRRTRGADLVVVRAPALSVHPFIRLRTRMWVLAAFPTLPIPTMVGPPPPPLHLLARLPWVATSRNLPFPPTRAPPLGPLCISVSSKQDHPWAYLRHYHRQDRSACRHRSIQEEEEEEAPPCSIPCPARPRKLSPTNCRI
jgi:hypothetical protein